MFDDFQKTIDGASRKRLRSSLAVATLVYGSSFTAVVAATAKVRQAAEEDLTQVEFAPPPEPPPPEPEAPPPEPVKSARPKVKRAALQPPKEVPLEKPKESDAELAEAKDTGPQDGSLDGVEGGTGTGRAPPPPPPPPKPMPMTKPVASSGNEKPPYPKAALRKGIEGVVVVSFEVLENGRVTGLKILSGPPELHEAVLKMLPNWRFKPAMRGGVPVRHRMSMPVRFRLEDA